MTDTKKTKNPANEKRSPKPKTPQTVEAKPIKRKATKKKVAYKVVPNVDIEGLRAMEAPNAGKFRTVARGAKVQNVSDALDIVAEQKADDGHLWGELSSGLWVDLTLCYKIG